jgi:hypothetical protein
LFADFDVARRRIELGNFLIPIVDAWTALQDTCLIRVLDTVDLVAMGVAPSSIYPLAIWY